MYKRNFYKGFTREDVEESMKAEGFKPTLLQPSAGYRYHLHQHPEEKLLAFLEGDMKVRTGNETYDCSAGDRLLVDGNIEHEAVVGPEGCTFFWAEK